MCSLLTPIEALDASDAFIMSIYGKELFEKWRALKYQMNFLSEQAYVRWLLELGEEHHANGGMPGIEECGSDIVSRLEQVGENGCATSVAAAACCGCKGDGHSAGCLILEQVCDQEVAEFCEVNSGHSLTSPPAAAALNTTDPAAAPGQQEDKGKDGETAFKLSLTGNKTKKDPVSEVHENGIETPVEAMDDAGTVVSTSDGEDSTTCTFGTSVGGGDNDSGDEVNMSSYYTVLPDDQCRNVYTCNMCYSYTTYRKSNILSHIREVHLKLKRLACNFCDYQCSRRGHLKDHLILKHGYLSKHTCNVCHRPFATRSKLERHQNACSNKGPAEANATKKKCTGKSKGKKKQRS